MKQQMKKSVVYFAELRTNFRQSELRNYKMKIIQKEKDFN